VLKEASKKLKLSTNIIEDSIYADLENEKILQSFKDLTPKELLEQYNLSLTQTLLFDSIELRFTTSENWQKIFFKAKKLGLMYEAYKNDDLWLRIDGPNCLFKLTRRYGSNMSKLIPYIISTSEWKIEAKILYKYTNEIYSFRINSNKHKHLFKVSDKNIVYDSKVEADFGSSFQALKAKWIIKREPEPLIVGKHVMIPDFSFERDSLKVYLEIVGFWTTAYLLRKIKKLGEIKVKMIVAVDESLACEALDQIENQNLIDIIYYKKRIPLSSVLNSLNDEYKKIYAKQIDFLKNIKINFTEPIIDFEEFASRIGVSVEVAREVITQNPPKDYLVYPRGLIKKEKIEWIKKKINKKMELNKKVLLSEMVEFLAKEKIDATSIINLIGYKIIWHGIDFKKAEIVKI